MQCPVCANDIQDSFGLIECSQCKTMLVADIDGNLKKFSTDEEPALKDNFKEDTKSTEVSEVSSEWSFATESSGEAESVSEDVVAEPANEEMPFEKNISTIDSSSIKTEDVNSFEDVQEFANSAASTLPHGDLVYDLFLEEIHNQEIRDEVELALIDPKLKIDFLKEDLKNGKIKLKNLNPVKVSVLVTKLKHLPIKIYWTQSSLIHGEEI